MADFFGSMVAIATPFADGDLDLEAFSALCEWHIEQGTNGLVVCGTTGEAATMHTEEKELACRRALEIAKQRVPVVLGTGTNATAASVQLTELAQDWGADGALVVTPYYNKPNQEGLFRHFEQVARVGLPIIAYDVPGRTGVTLAEQTVHRIAELPHVVALKDATHDVERAGRLAAETDLTILSGDDGVTLAMMKLGAKGVISVAANVVPKEMAQLCGTQDPGLHEQLAPIFAALFCDSNPIPLKYALCAMGKIRNELRLPLVPLSPELEPLVDDALRAVGAIEA